MEKNKISLLDEHLQAMQGMAEAGTDDYFYTRLKARMENQQPQQGWAFPLKPVWVIGTLALLLAANTFILTQQSRTRKASTTSSSTIQGFAESYDQTISSSY